MEQYYLVEEIGLFNRASFSKIAGQPKAKAAHGGLVRKTVRQQEITLEQFLSVSIDQLVDLYWPKKEKPND